jgi:hypothetical protein
MKMHLPFSREVFVDIETFTDSDHANDKETRKSISCGTMFANGALIESHSRKQSVIATSSAEAEYYALATGAAETLAVVSLMQEIQIPVQGRLRCDSSAGRALAVRCGFGRVKHIDVRLLWLQQVLEQRRLTLEPVTSRENPADVGTKPVSAGRLEELCRRLGVEGMRDVDLIEEEEPQDITLDLVQRCQVPGTILSWLHLALGLLRLTAAIEDNDEEQILRRRFEGGHLGGTVVTSSRLCRGDENHLRLLILASLTSRVAAVGPSGDAWTWFDLAALVVTILAAIGVHRIASVVRQMCARKTRTIGTQSQTTYRGRFIPLGEAQHGAWPAPSRGQ